MMHAAESPNQPCHEPHASSHMLQVESPLNRRRVEAFIQRCFRQDYAAQIDVYAKHLIRTVSTATIFMLISWSIKKTIY